MRLWLLLPIILPACWVAMTFGELWPEGTPDVMNSPAVGASTAIIGIVMAMLVERWIKANPGGKLRKPWFARLGSDADASEERPAGAEAAPLVVEDPEVMVHETRPRAWAAPTPEPAKYISGSTEDPFSSEFQPKTPMISSMREAWASLRVEMPEPMSTATPAPHR